MIFKNTGGRLGSKAEGMAASTGLSVLTSKAGYKGRDNTHGRRFAAQKVRLCFYAAVL